MIEIDDKTFLRLAQAYKRSTAYFLKDGSTYKLHATPATQVAQYAISVQRIALDIVSTNELPFEWRVHKDGYVELFLDSLGDLILGLLIRIDRDEFADSFPLYEFNPLWGRLLTMIDERQLIAKARSPIWKQDGEALCSLVDDLNLFIHDFRQECRSDQFASLLKGYMNRSSKNEHALRQLIDGAFERCSRIMAVRMNVGYKTYPDLLPNGQWSIELDTAIAHRETLMQVLKHAFRDSLISCAWKLEHCLEKGYGFHLLLLFDASKHSDDIAAGKAIGEAWDGEVTKGAGFNCCYNVSKGKLNFDYLGVISRRHTKIIRLFTDRVVSYLAEGDYFMKIRSDMEDQAFGTVSVAAAGSPSIERAGFDASLVQPSTL